MMTKNRKRTVSQEYIRGFGDAFYERREAGVTVFAAVCVVMVGFALGVVAAALLGWS